MASANFSACMAQVAKWEGWHVFTNNPHDEGGATYSGVTQRAYDGWRHLKGLPPQGVSKASDAEIYAIYRSQYWDAVKGDVLPRGVDMMMFSVCVNSGPRQAILFLQRSLRVTADGWLGLETMNALQKAGSVRFLIQSIADQRESFWEHLKDWVYFGRGWINRGNDDERDALAMV